MDDFDDDDELLAVTLPPAKRTHHVLESVACPEGKQPRRALEFSEIHGFIESIRAETLFSWLPAKVLDQVLLAALSEVHLQGEYIEFFVDQRGGLWHGLRSRISAAYPPTVRRITGSIFASIVGLSRKGAYPPDIWRAWTGHLGDFETTVIESNDDMAYGTEFEPRVRQIFRQVICPVREPGFYVDLKKQHLGVSPDGITPPIRLLVPGDGLVSTMRLGTTILEIKCSRYLLRKCPQIEHIVQMHEEMAITRSRYGWLQYWRGDTCRIWLFEFCDSFWQWCLRRAEGFLQACCDDWPLNEELSTTMGFELQDLWFGDQKWPVKLSDAQKRYAPPERPRFWKVFECEQSRTDQHQDRDFEGAKVYPVHKDDADPWFAKTWQHVATEQRLHCGAACDLQIYDIQKEE